MHDSEVAHSEIILDRHTGAGAQRTTSLRNSVGYIFGTGRAHLSIRTSRHHRPNVAQLAQQSRATTQLSREISAAIRRRRRTTGRSGGPRSTAPDTNSGDAFERRGKDAACQSRIRVTASGRPKQGAAAKAQRLRVPAMRDTPASPRPKHSTTRDSTADALLPTPRPLEGP